MDYVPLCTHTIVHVPKVQNRVLCHKSKRANVYKFIVTTKQVVGASGASCRRSESKTTRVDVYDA